MSWRRDRRNGGFLPENVVFIGISGVESGTRFSLDESS